MQIWRAEESFGSRTATRHGIWERGVCCHLPFFGFIRCTKPWDTPLPCLCQQALPYSHGAGAKPIKV